MFFADYARDRFQIHEPGGGVADFGEPGGWGNPVDLTLGPNGNVVYVSISSGEIREIVAVEPPDPASGSHSLSFDGDDVARDASAAGLPAGHPYTVSAWFRAEPTTETRYLVQHGANTSPQSGWGLRRLADGRIQFAHHGEGSVTFAPTTPTGEWVFVAVSGTGSATRLDTWDAASGWRQDTLPALPAMTPPDAPLSVGGALDATRDPFDGLIDDVRVWSVARSSAALAGDHDVTLTGTEAGLVGYWRLDEGAGAGAGDSTTAGNTLSLVGPPGWSPIPPSPPTTSPRAS